MFLYSQQLHVLFIALEGWLDSCARLNFDRLDLLDINLISCATILLFRNIIFRNTQSAIGIEKEKRRNKKKTDV